MESGVKKHQIFTYDINPNYKDEIENLGISFKTQDTLLSLYPDSYNEFDIIVGNPPYLNKASEYVRKNKLKLKKIYGKINAHETYSMFIINSIWRLKKGGKLGFITSDSYLTLSTHRKLRKFILDNCIINKILLAPKYLFSYQNVHTSPAIIILTKFPGKKYKKIRQENLLRIIPRVSNEQEYFNSKNVREIKQKKYYSLPFNIFFIDVDDQIIELFEKAPRLKNFVKGYIGMHTHNNRKYIAAIENTELADIFRKRNKSIINNEKKYKIISREELISGNWKPYLKRGGSDQYFRTIMEALAWDDDSKSKYDIPRNVIFEKEGIVISGVSSRLAARYMPEGCYWDSNKAIGFYLIDNSISIEYLLGLLNSSLYNYLMKGIINNTNSIQISGIKVLPFVVPDKDVKEKVENLVKKIIKNKKQDLNYDYIMEQKEIDDIIFNFYKNRFNLSDKLRTKLDNDYAIYKRN